MFTPETGLTAITLLLLSLVCVATGWLFYLRYQLSTIKSANKKGKRSPSTENHHQIMPYTEYKKRYGSRSREIAIIRRDFDLVYTVGFYAAQIARHVTFMHHHLIPIVFSNVRDTWWRIEEEKKQAFHMTGVTGSSHWKKRIDVFIAAKPNIQRVLLFMSKKWGIEPAFKTEISAINAIFTCHNIQTFNFTSLSPGDILHILPNYVNKIDSIINIRHALSSQIAKQISNFCNKRSITFFSTCFDDVKQGAALGVSGKDMKVGYLSAQKALSILEEHKQPYEIELSNISKEHTYAAQFNIECMKKQGLNPELIPDIALQLGKTVQFQTRENNYD